MVIAGILYIWCWKVLSWAIILVAKSARGDCETALASLLGFLIGFVIADLHRVKTAWENLGFVVEDSELLTVTLLSVFTAARSLEKVTWLWIPLWVSPIGAHPYNSSTHAFQSPSFTSLFYEVIFLKVLLFSLSFILVFFSANSTGIVNLLHIYALFVFDLEANIPWVASPAIPPFYICKTHFFTLPQPHNRKAFSKAEVANVGSADFCKSSKVSWDFL